MAMWNDDPLKAAIEECRREREELVREAERLARDIQVIDVRIAAYEEAAALRPLQLSQSNGRDTGSGPRNAQKGRQPGAISKRWRHVLAMMHVQYPAGATEEAIVEIAQASGLPNARRRDVQGRMNFFREHEYVEFWEENWRVTAQAVRKFNLEALANESVSLPAKETETADDSPSSAVVDIERLS